MSATVAPLIPREAATASDADAIARLGAQLALQRTAFRADPYPSAAERRERLGALAAMLMGNRARIRAAVAADFGSHPEAFTDLIEILGPAGRVAHALESLEEWMRESERPADPGLLGTARVSMRYEPKGVIGNMAPWNFPFEIGCGPLAEMLAAGNRVIVKPSDLTPACGELLAELVAEAFDPAHVTVAAGGLELARAFSAQPWDHLMYTGSPAIGREVMRAASEHLVPVTLELGGKCPAVLTPSGVTEAAVEAIVGTKLIKNGQMCITVDHVLCPRDQVGTLVELIRRHVAGALAGHAASGDCVGLITARHLARIEAMLDEARAAGAEVVATDSGAGTGAEDRRLGLSLVIDPGPELRLSQEEIFGPILPIVPYDDLDAAAAAIDAEHRPLAVYVFGDDPAECERVLRAVRTGGACVNACALQGAIPSLGFGGSGTSGFGRHHGIEGFREFSTARGTVVRGTGDNLDVLYPPYGDKVQAVIEAAFAGG